MTKALSLTVLAQLSNVTDRQTDRQFDRGVELGGRVWYPVKLLHISYNLFAGTEMLSLSVYEPIAIQMLQGGTVPQFGGGKGWS